MISPRSPNFQRTPVCVSPHLHIDDRTLDFNNAAKRAFERERAQHICMSLKLSPELNRARLWVIDFLGSERGWLIVARAVVGRACRRLDF